MRVTLLIITVVTLFTACQKQPVNDVVGMWQIEKQLIVHYSGHDKLSETTTEVYNSFMELSSTGTGSLIYPTGELAFDFIVTVDELILSSELCKRSTWFFAEYTGDNMILEHSSPGMVTIRYLRRNL